MISISRIATQLKEDPRIADPSKADQKLSVCGLRLEHMVATLYKKKPTFNIESVNTDYSSGLPPYFLGIKNSMYIGDVAEAEEENSLERIYNMQNKEKSQKRDDQQKFLEDKYKDMKVQIRNLKEGKILRQK